MSLLAAFAFANLKHDLAALWSWLCHRSFWQLVAMGLAIFALVQHFQLATARSSANRWQRQFAAEHKARLTDLANYQQAQKDAAAKNLAVVASVKRQQKGISDETVAMLNDRLARLRRELQPAAQGHPFSAGLSSGGQGPAGASGQAGVCLSPAELLRAAENEERHDRLIDWVERQSAVEPGK